jgi:hypothetical protein
MKRVPDNHSWIKFYCHNDIKKKYKGRLLLEGKTRQNDLADFVKGRVDKSNEVK